VTIKLNESEARALKAITAYGPDKFCDWFYKNLGKAYMEQHEKGLHSLFNTISKNLDNELRKVDSLKKIIVESLENKKV